MAPAVLDRVAETTGTDQASRAIEATVALFEMLPWAKELTAAEFLAFITELHPAAEEWRRTRDIARVAEIVEGWQATAEARQNRGLQEHLARTDRTYVPWR